MHNLTPSPASSLLNRIVIVGQGAIGLLYYHHFNKMQLKVSLKASTKSCQLHKHYTFTAFNEKTHNNYPLKYAQVSDIEQADVVVLCVKSYQVATAAQQLAPLVKPTSLVILAHNGMGVHEEIIKYFPVTQPILALLTTHGCLRTSPFNIVHTGVGKTDIGLLSGELTVDESATLTSLFNQIIPLTEYHQNIDEMQWLKLAINCVINPITALNNIDNGQVNDAEFKAQIIKILAELVLVAKMQGVFFSLEMLVERVTSVASSTALNSSSMRCDVLANRVTEIDYINGYIHRLGLMHNIATPENSKLWQQVTELTQDF